MPAPHFPVQHSVLSEDALADWAQKTYGLKSPVRCRFLRSSMSDVYRINAPGRSCILKIYLHGRHTQPEIQAEIDFLLDLVSGDLPVVVPLADVAGAFVNELDAPEGKRCGVLFEAIAGEAPQETNLAHSRSFGQLVARIHQHADQAGKTYPRWHLDETYLISQPLAQIAPYLEQRGADWEFLQSLGQALSTKLLQLVPKETPQYGLVHGDLHTGNAHIAPNGRLTLFDFDSFGYGWRAIDIGVYHVSFDWMGLEPRVRRKKERFWAAFLEGYNRQRPLGENELEAAQLCLALRHLELMGLTIRYWAPHIGSDWIDNAYFDQHMDWFKKWSAEYGLELG